MRLAYFYRGADESKNSFSEEKKQSEWYLRARGATDASAAKISEHQSGCVRPMSDERVNDGDKTMGIETLLFSHLSIAKNICDI